MSVKKLNAVEDTNGIKFILSAFAFAIAALVILTIYVPAYWRI